MPVRPAAMSDQTAPTHLPPPPQEPDVDEQFSTPAQALRTWPDTPTPAGVTPHRPEPDSPPPAAGGAGDVQEGTEIREPALFPHPPPGATAFVHVVHHVTENIERPGAMHVELRVPIPGPASQPIQFLQYDPNRRRAIIKNLVGSSSTVSLARSQNAAVPAGPTTYPLEAGQFLEIKDCAPWWAVGETGADGAGVLAITVTRDQEDARGPDTTDVS